MTSDRNMTLVKSEWLEDWYVIEFAQHDGREWVEMTGPNSMAFCRSARVSDADPEGTANEMLLIAAAIEGGGSDESKRVAAITNADGSVSIRSPRNSTVEHSASREAALGLAREIRRVVAESTK